MQGVAFHIGDDLVRGRRLVRALRRSDVDVVQVARAIEQPVQGEAVRHAGVGAVVQFVVAVQETALQLVAGRACGIAQSLESLGFAEQLAHGVIGKGQGRPGSGGPGRRSGRWLLPRGQCGPGRAWPAGGPVRRARSR